MAPNLLLIVIRDFFGERDMKKLKNILLLLPLLLLVACSDDVQMDILSEVVDKDGSPVGKGYKLSGRIIGAAHSDGINGKLSDYSKSTFEGMINENIYFGTTNSSGLLVVSEDNSPKGQDTIADVFRRSGVNHSMSAVIVILESLGRDFTSNNAYKIAEASDQHGTDYDGFLLGFDAFNEETSPSASNDEYMSTVQIFAELIFVPINLEDNPEQADDSRRDFGKVYDIYDGDFGSGEGVEESSEYDGSTFGTGAAQ